MNNRDDGPVGQRIERASARRGQRNASYREARAKYAQIRELRAANPLAAHLLERRLELKLTCRQVASAANTSEEVVRGLESGTAMPTPDVLRRIAAVLDDELHHALQGTSEATDSDVASLVEAIRAWPPSS